jgi:hypothetical protein
MSTTKINELHDAPVVHDHIIQLQIPMCKTQAVKIGYAVENLKEATGDFLASHLSSHNDSKKVEWCVLHDFVPPPSLMKNVERLNDVAVMQC